MPTLRQTRLDTRARELLLPERERRAFVALADYLAADYAFCPSCGDDVAESEAAMVTHARGCRLLQADAMQAD